MESNDFVEESVIEIIDNESNPEGKEEELKAVPQDLEGSPETPVENATSLDVESNVGAGIEERIDPQSTWNMVLQSMKQMVQL